ncbi:MAG: hypothetical protein GX456_15095 [Verrucomicrobia bacterium]|nr:hypothetical protein [Verrucomicrobiota bacterium]
MRRSKHRHVQSPPQSASQPAPGAQLLEQRRATGRSQLPAQVATAQFSTRIPWTTLILAVLVWVYVCFWIHPPLLYDHAWKPFYMEKAFFARALSQPGGLVAYAAAFLWQLNQFSAAGALVTAAMIGLLGSAAAKTVQRNAIVVPLFAVIPGVAILLMEGRYAHGVYDVGLGAFLSAGAWFMWKRFGQAADWRSVGLALAISAAVYWLAGTIFAAVFALSTSITATRWKRSVLGAWPYWLVTATLLAVGVINSHQVAREFIAGRPDIVAILARVLIYLYLPAIAGLARQMPDTSEFSKPPHLAGAASHSPEKEPPTAMPFVRRDGFVFAATLLVAAVVLWLTFDRQTRLLGSVRLAALDHQWESVLALARQLKTEPTPVVRLAIARALYHQGKLNKELFAYPQRKGVEVLPSLREGLEVCRLLADTMIELGQVNLAEHFAHESLELEGERPRTLWQLGRIYVLKDQPKAAAVFLKRLSLVPFHRTRALQRLKAMELDPTLSSEPDISPVRPLRVTNDIADSGLPTEVVVRQCLGSNRRNRMAFEFMLAHYLLETNLEQVAKNVEFLGDYGVWETPRHVEEALLLRDSLAGTNQTTSSRPTSAPVAQRFELLRKTLRANNGKVEGIEDVLIRDFGDTYWFYHLFGRTFGAKVRTYKPPK